MSVKIIDTIKPKNNGTFPVVEAVDVAVTSDMRLPAALNAKAAASDLAATNAAVAGKANSSDLATATANLQSQIDQIEISASAEAVVAPEVLAARVGFGGTSYSTLKERLDAEEELNNTNEDMFNSVFGEVVSPTKTVNKYINISGDAATFVTSQSAASNTLIFDVEPNTTYYLYPVDDVSTLKAIPDSHIAREMDLTESYSTFVNVSTIPIKYIFKTSATTKSLAIYCGTGAEFTLKKITDERISSVEHYIANEYDEVSPVQTVDGLYIQKRGNDFEFTEATSADAKVYVFKCEKDMYFEVENATKFILAYTQYPISVYSGNSTTVKDGSIFINSTPPGKIYFEKPSDANYLYIYIGNDSSQSLSAYNVNLKDQLEELMKPVDDFMKPVEAETTINASLMFEENVNGGYYLVQNASENAAIYEFTCDDDLFIEFSGATTFRLMYSATQLNLAAGLRVTTAEGFVDIRNIVDKKPALYRFQKRTGANYVYVYIGNKENKSIKAYKYNVASLIDYKIDQSVLLPDNPITQYTAIGSVPATVAQYHELWDEFVENGIATRTLLATVQDLPIYMYTIKAARKWSYAVNDEFTVVDDDTLYSRPIVLIDSGIHGDEKGTPLFLYEFVKRLCYDKAYSDYLDSIDFYFVPIVNPTGYNANKRTNYQNIDINRDCTNFQTVEGRALKEVIDDLGADFYMDMHQFATGSSLSPEVCGTISVPYESTQEEMDAVYRIFIRGGEYANALVSDYAQVDYAQRTFPWQSNNNNTFRNYAKGKADRVVTLETSKYCYDISGIDNALNRASMIFGNAVSSEAIKRFLNELI